MPGRGAGHDRQCVEPGCILASREDDRGAEAGLTPPGLCGEHDEPRLPFGLRRFLPWTNYFQVGTVNKAYRALDNYAASMAGPGSDRKSYAHTRDRRQNFHGNSLLSIQHADHGRTRRRSRAQPLGRRECAAGPRFVPVIMTVGINASFRAAKKRSLLLL